MATFMIIGLSQQYPSSAKMNRFILYTLAQLGRGPEKFAPIFERELHLLETEDENCIFSVRSS